MSKYIILGVSEPGSYIVRLDKVKIRNEKVYLTFTALKDLTERSRLVDILEGMGCTSKEIDRFFKRRVDGHL